MDPLFLSLGGLFVGLIAGGIFSIRAYIKLARAEEKLEALEDFGQRFSSEFRALSAEALKSNNQSFLELAKTSMETFQEAAKGDLDKRQEAVQAMVKPVRESLNKVDAKILDLEKAREGAYQGLCQQVTSLLESQKELRSETSNLVKDIANICFCESIPHPPRIVPASFNTSKQNTHF